LAAAMKQVADHAEQAAGSRIAAGLAGRHRHRAGSLLALLQHLAKLGPLLRRHVVDGLLQRGLHLLRRGFLPDPPVHLIGLARVVALGVGAARVALIEILAALHRRRIVAHAAPLLAFGPAFLPCCLALSAIAAALTLTAAKEALQ